MAQATKNAVVVETVEVLLKLTESEAKVLAGILGSIGGIPSGPRGDTDRISAALYSLGYHWSNRDFGVSGALTLTADPREE